MIHLGIMVETDQLYPVPEEPVKFCTVHPRIELDEETGNCPACESDYVGLVHSGVDFDFPQTLKIATIMHYNFASLIVILMVMQFEQMFSSMFIFFPLFGYLIVKAFIRMGNGLETLSSLSYYMTIIIDFVLCSLFILFGVVSTSYPWNILEYLGFIFLIQAILLIFNGTTRKLFGLSDTIKKKFFDNKEYKIESKTTLEWVESKLTKLILPIVLIIISGIRRSNMDQTII